MKLATPSHRGGVAAFYKQPHRRFSMIYVPSLNLPKGSRIASWVSSFALLTTITLGGNSTFANDVDFNRDVRPILSGKCFQCHGPDAAARKAGLRLDVREKAIASLKS